MSEIEIPMCSAGHVCLTCRDAAGRQAMAEAGMELSAKLAERDAAFPQAKREVSREDRRRGVHAYSAVVNNDGTPVFDADGKRIAAVPPAPTATLILRDGRKVVVRPSGYPPTEEQAALTRSSSDQSGSWAYETDAHGVKRMVRQDSPPPKTA